MTPAAWAQLGYLATGVVWMVRTHHRITAHWAEMWTLGTERWWRITTTAAYTITLAGYGLTWPITAGITAGRAAGRYLAARAYRRATDAPFERR